VNLYNHTKCGGLWFTVYVVSRRAGRISRWQAGKEEVTG